MLLCTFRQAGRFAGFARDGPGGCGAAAVSEPDAGHGLHGVDGRLARAAAGCAACRADSGTACQRPAHRPARRLRGLSRLHRCPALADAAAVPRAAVLARLPAASAAVDSGATSGGRRRRRAGGRDRGAAHGRAHAGRSPQQRAGHGLPRLHQLCPAAWRQPRLTATACTRSGTAKSR